MLKFNHYFYDSLIHEFCNMKLQKNQKLFFNLKKNWKTKKLEKNKKLHDVKIAINSNIAKFHDKTPYLILMHSLGC